MHNSPVRHEAFNWCVWSALIVQTIMLEVHECVLMRFEQHPNLWNNKDQQVENSNSGVSSDFFHLKGTTLGGQWPHSWLLSRSFKPMLPGDHVFEITAADCCTLLPFVVLSIKFQCPSQKGNNNADSVRCCPYNASCYMQFGQNYHMVRKNDPLVHSPVVFQNHFHRTSHPFIAIWDNTVPELELWPKHPSLWCLGGDNFKMINDEPWQAIILMMVVVILLMAEILHHLGCMKPYK